jgi:PatG Domain
MMSDAAGGPLVEHGAVPAPMPVANPAPCVTCGQVPGQPMGAQQMMMGAMPGQDMVPGVTRMVGPVLAVGRVRSSFPNLGLQREYAEAAGADPEALVASNDLKELISQDEYRYLAHQMCWMFTVQSVDVCVVVPRSAEDVNELVSMAADEEDTVQVLLGQPTTTAAAPECLNDDLPMVSPVQLLSFTIDEFASALAQRYDADRATSKRGKAGADRADGTGNDPHWQAMVRDVFYRLTRRAGTTGFRDEDRARNYVALKDPAVYAMIWNALSNGQSLIGIGSRELIRGGRRLGAVWFTFRHHQTHVVERYETLIDTQDLFCFKAAPLTPTYD